VSSAFHKRYVRTRFRRFSRVTKSLGLGLFATGRERFTTQLASVLLFFLVRPYMGRQITIPLELFLAYVARIGFIAGMSPLVVRQSRNVRERFLADVARIEFLAGSFVVRQVRNLREGFRANVAWALFFTTVRFRVDHQVGILSKRLRTNTARNWACRRNVSLWALSNRSVSQLYSHKLPTDTVLF